MIFVNSMSDLFHEDVPDEYVVAVAEVMAAANWHTYQVLTKRSDRLRSMLNDSLSFAANQSTYLVGSECRKPEIWTSPHRESCETPAP